ncbi:MAG: ATP-binding protein [Elusimicrobia bacterium]|nr:ATP-binding protein [Elusimicrobiota bacterium]
MLSPKYIDRVVNVGKTLKHKSVLLLGPRLTGKSSLVRHTLKGVRVYNLLDNDVFVKLSRQPSRMREELIASDKMVVIDEIQKLPVLLDEAQMLIEERAIRFLLTGSSARKLRRGGVNLLGGRARTITLHPFVSKEIAHLDLARALEFGLLPPVYFSGQPEADIADYVGTYLREEIAAEGLTRNIPAFSRFLEVAALCNGQQINFTKISNDAQVARSTIQEYFEILKDTLLAYELPAWQRTIKRKPVQVHKFYFFDGGVAHCLKGGGVLKEKSPEFGSAFESFIFHSRVCALSPRKVNSNIWSASAWNTNGAGWASLK